jgi:hypothetical protein
MYGAAIYGVYTYGDSYYLSVWKPTSPVATTWTDVSFPSTTWEEPSLPTTTWTEV